MVEAAGVELDWPLRQSALIGEFWPDSASARRPSEHAAPETRDVAGNSTLFCGAHGEAAGTSKRRELAPPPPRPGLKRPGTLPDRLSHDGYHQRDPDALAGRKYWPELPRIRPRRS